MKNDNLKSNINKLNLKYSVELAPDNKKITYSQDFIIDEVSIAIFRLALAVHPIKSYQLDKESTSFFYQKPQSNLYIHHIHYREKYFTITTNTIIKVSLLQVALNNLHFNN